VSLELLQGLGIIALLGGLISLDRRRLLQGMISQPIVIVPFLGLFFGSPEGLLWLGGLLQLLWLSSFFFGANIPPNETLASLCIAGMVLLFSQSNALRVQDPCVWVPALLLGLPFSFLGRLLEMRLDHFNQYWAQKADAYISAAQFSKLSLIPYKVLLKVFLLNALIVALGSLAGAVLLQLINPLLSGTLLIYIIGWMAYYMIPALGIAAALTVLKERLSLILAFASYLTFITTKIFVVF